MSPRTCRWCQRRSSGACPARPAHSWRKRLVTSGVSSTAMCVRFLGPPLPFAADRDHDAIGIGLKIGHGEPRGQLAGTRQPRRGEHQHERPQILVFSICHPINAVCRPPAATGGGARRPARQGRANRPPGRGAAGLPAASFCLRGRPGPSRRENHSASARGALGASGVSLDFRARRPRRGPCTPRHEVAFLQIQYPHGSEGRTEYMPAEAQIRVPACLRVPRLPRGDVGRNGIPHGGGCAALPVPPAPPPGAAVPNPAPSLRLARSSGMASPSTATPGRSWACPGGASSYLPSPR